jgi:concanavalin A-like lectin/glucanase superfamily protein
MRQLFQDPITVGQWIHIVGVADPKTRRTAIYKNGELRHSDSYAAKITPAVREAPLRFGTKDQASFFRGAIGTGRVWHRALDAPAVHDLYAGNVVPDGLVAEYSMTEGSGSVVHDTVSGHNGVVHSASWGKGAGSIQESTGTQGGG